jgi:hypothetical protein
VNFGCCSRSRGGGICVVLGAVRLLDLIAAATISTGVRLRLDSSREGLMQRLRRKGADMGFGGAR